MYRVVYSVMYSVVYSIVYSVVHSVTVPQALQALLFSQRTHLQRAVAKHDMVQSEGEYTGKWP